MSADRPGLAEYMDRDREAVRSYLRIVEGASLWDLTRALSLPEGRVTVALAGLIARSIVERADTHGTMRFALTLDRS